MRQTAAILTWCVSRDNHRFQNILVEVGFQGGVPIDEAFFRKHISGRHNPEIAGDLCLVQPQDGQALGRQPTGCSRHGSSHAHS